MIFLLHLLSVSLHCMKLLKIYQLHLLPWSILFIKLFISPISMIFLQQVIKLLLLKSYNHHCVLGIGCEFNIVLEDGLTNGHENLLLTLLPIISLSMNQATTRNLSPHLNHLIGNRLCNLNTSLFWEIRLGA
jgi:hypothetical protein